MEKGTSSRSASIHSDVPRKSRPAIALVVHRQGLYQAESMARVLNAHEVPVHIWTMDPTVFDIAGSFDGVCRVIDLGAGFRRSHIGESEYRRALGRLRELEVAWGTPFFHQDEALDRMLTGITDAEVVFQDVRSPWSRQEIAVMAIAVYDATRREMIEQKLLAVVGETNTLPYRLIYRVAESLGIPHLRPEIVPHSGGRMYFEDALGSRWTRCQELYTRFAAEGVPSGPSEWADGKLSEVIEARHASALFHTSLAGGARSVQTRLMPSNVARSFREWREALGPRSRDSPRGVDPSILSPTAKGRRLVRSVRRSRFYESVALRSIPREEYACMFLHVQPEHTVECLAFEYQDQVALARNLAAALPADVLLLVKDHPLCGGRRSSEFYGEIRSIPGVELLHHSVDTSAAIDRSQLTATLTGTVALESICSGVACVVFGESYYRGFAGVYPGGTIASLREQFSEWPLPGASVEECRCALAARYVASQSCSSEGGGLSWQDGAAVGRALIVELSARALLPDSRDPELSA